MTVYIVTTVENVKVTDFLICVYTIDCKVLISDRVWHNCCGGAQYLRDASLTEGSRSGWNVFPQDAY